MKVQQEQSLWFKTTETLLFQSSGIQKSKIKVSRGLVPSESCKGESMPGLSQLLVAPGNP